MGGPSRSIGRRLQLLWRWSWVFTLPAASVYVLWVILVAGRYFDFGIRYGTLGDIATLHRLGVMEFRHLARGAELTVMHARTPADSELRRVDVFLGEADEARLDARLPASGREYVKGALFYPDGSLREVSLRYRGDYDWHWATYKKSLRVKTKKKSLFESSRRFNLIAPKGEEKIRGYLSYWLGGEMGLMTPRAELVDVFVNGSNRGLHLMVEQLEELVLRRSGRMPGDIYSGELVGRDAHEGLHHRLFSHPGAWKKLAVNNHYPESSNEPLQQLCDLVSGPRTEERSAALRDLVDVEAFGRFAAYRVILQTLHFDDAHNWRLYYDPWKNAFEPICWDPDGWHPNWAPRAGQRALPDVIRCDLDRALARDHRYLDAQHAAIADYFQSGLHERFLAEFDRTVGSVRPSLESDPSLVCQFQYNTPAQTLAAIDRLRGRVIAITDSIHTQYLGQGSRFEYAQRPTTRDGEARLDLSILTRRPVRLLEFELSEVPRKPVSATFAYSVGGLRKEVDVTGAASLRGTQLTIERSLTSRLDYEFKPWSPRRGRERISKGPGVYELILRGLAEAEMPIIDARIVFAGGEELRGAVHESIPPAGFGEGRGVVMPARVHSPVIFSGEVTIEGVRHIDGPVQIMPGTTLLLAPGASLVIGGRLTARGTSEQPIRFSPRDEGQAPWGVVAVRGQAARGSELVHCTFSGGSGHMLPLAEYSAMLSIHDVPEISVSECNFRDSQVVDDMVHAVYAHVRFEGCTFERSPFDALDLDMCTGSVTNCRFTDSGNDALDLMTSEVVISDTLMDGSGDKAISVGEGAQALVLNCRITRCQMGIQVKDGSRAVVANTDLSRNGVAVDAYKKNWRYDGGGTVFLYGCLMDGNTSSLTADRDSRMYVHDSWIDRPSEFKKRIHADEYTAYGYGSDTAPKPEHRLRARHPKVFRFPEDLNGTADIFATYWTAVDPRRRGVRSDPAR